MIEADPNAVPLREYVEAMLRQRDKQVDAAIAAAALATTKAERATEKRFEGDDKFREALDDASKRQVPRTEYAQALNQIDEKIDAVKEALDSKIADLKGSNRAGASSLWGYIVGAGGLIVALIVLFTQGV